MEKEQPPDPTDWDLDMSSTDDKINAYNAVASSYLAGIQPAIFLTHSFLQEHPILLEEGYLTVNWDQISGLYAWTDKLLMVRITDAQWEKWGWPGGLNNMGARHPGRQLHAQHGCGGVQGGISRRSGPPTAEQGRPFYDYCMSSGLHRTAAV